MTEKETTERWAEADNMEIEELEKQDEDEAKARSTFYFFPNEQAFEKNNVIGWAKVHEHPNGVSTSEVRIGLPSAVIKTILNELRGGIQQGMYASGVENEKGRIQITAFSMLPAD